MSRWNKNQTNNRGLSGAKKDLLFLILVRSIGSCVLDQKLNKTKLSTEDRTEFTQSSLVVYVSLCK